MPSFISKDGVWTPASEKAVNVRTAEVYEGPDREALKFIATENGISVEDAKKSNAHIGMLASEDPEMFEVAKKHGFTSVDDYLKAKKPTPQQVAIQKEAQSKVVTHQPPAPKPGVDTGTKGGFYDPEKQQSPVSQFDKKG